MDIEIENFLQPLVTPEVMDELKRAYDVFDLYEVPNHADTFLDLIYGKTYTEEQTTVSIFISGYREQLSHILRLHDIAMQDHCPLSGLIDVALGLKSIDDYADMDSVIDICNGDEVPLERFANVMELVTPYTAEELMLVIDNVNEGIIQKIKNLKPLTPPEPVDLNIATLVSDMAKYRAMIAPFELSYQVMLDAGMAYGMPLQTYLAYYLKTAKSADLFDNLHLEQFIRDVIGLILISKDRHADLHIALTQIVSEITSDLQVSLKADVYSKKLIKAFLNEKN